MPLQHLWSRIGLVSHVDGRVETAPEKLCQSQVNDDSPICFMLHLKDKVLSDQCKHDLWLFGIWILSPNLKQKKQKCNNIVWVTEHKCSSHVNAVDNVDLRLLENVDIVLVTTPAHHYVFRLEVLMNYIPGVEVKQPVTHAHDDGALIFQRQLKRDKIVLSQRSFKRIICSFVHLFPSGLEFNKKIFGAWPPVHINSTSN